jgi:hypothetical protein
MAALRSLVVRSCDAAAPRFPAVFEEQQKWFRRPDKMFLRAPRRETRSQDRYSLWLMRRTPAMSISPQGGLVD